MLATFQTPAATDFFDTLSLTYDTPLDVPDASDDLKRELEFYKQSLWAAQTAHARFERAGRPFSRPDDYFAEMVKSDAHMAKVRQSLLDEKTQIKAREDARKLREGKKFGKKVQIERQREREMDKKRVGESIDRLKKRRKDSSLAADDFDVALEDALADKPKGGRGGKDRRAVGGARGNMSRKARDSKYGHPKNSQLRRPKENNDKVDGDPWSKKRKAGGGGGGPPKKKQRPGKSRRR